MGRRGRPRHPDILTPREWEVLAQLRRGLSNPEIAQRLGIGREGVKYHVSEILGKLGVTNREEAAVWQRGQRAWPLAALAPLGLLLRKVDLMRLATPAAAMMVAVAAAGLGLLVWGLIRTHGTLESELSLPGGPSAAVALETTATPTPAAPPAPTATPPDEQAIALAQAAPLQRSGSPGMSVDSRRTVPLGETFTVYIYARDTPNVDISAFTTEVLLPARLTWLPRESCADEVFVLRRGGAPPAVCERLTTARGGVAHYVVSATGPTPVTPLAVDREAKATFVTFDVRCVIEGSYHLVLTANRRSSTFGAAYSDVQSNLIEVKTMPFDVDGDTSPEQVADASKVVCGSGVPPATTPASPPPATSAPQTPTPVSSGSISGRIAFEGPDGEAGAHSFWLVPAQIAPPIDLSAGAQLLSTGSDGTFAVEGLAAGDYFLIPSGTPVDSTLPYEAILVTRGGEDPTAILALRVSVTNGQETGGIAILVRPAAPAP